MQDKDVIISTLLKRIEELQRQLLAALEREQQKDKFTQEQAVEILKLQERIARLEKNSSTSSKPPSSDITNPPVPKGKKKKRKRGGQRGHSKHTRRKGVILSGAAAGCAVERSLNTKQEHAVRFDLILQTEKQEALSVSKP